MQEWQMIFHSSGLGAYPGGKAAVSVMAETVEEAKERCQEALYAKINGLPDPPWLVKWEALTRETQQAAVANAMREGWENCRSADDPWWLMARIAIDTFEDELAKEGVRAHW